VASRRYGGGHRHGDRPGRRRRPLALCLLVLTTAPAVTVVGYELVGHRHRAAMLARSGITPVEGDVAP
jgi:hypothetical protein